MRPLSQQLASLVPAMLAVALIFLSALPVAGGALTYTPNIAWVMTLVMMMLAPEHWSRGLAFALGLLQDILFGTPLGSQALLALLIAQWAMLHKTRSTSLLFRVRWLEATGVLVMMHGLLFAIIHLTGLGAPKLVALVMTGLVNALWFALLYRMTQRFVREV